MQNLTPRVKFRIFFRAYFMKLKPFSPFDEEVKNILLLKILVIFGRCRRFIGDVRLGSCATGGDTKKRETLHFHCGSLQKKTRKYTISCMTLINKMRRRLIFQILEGLCFWKLLKKMRAVRCTGLLRSKYLACSI